MGHSQILLTQNALPPAQNAVCERSLVPWVAEVTALALVHLHISWSAQPSIKRKKLNHKMYFITTSPRPRSFVKMTNLYFVDSFPPCKFLKFSLDLGLMKALHKQWKNEIKKMFFALVQDLFTLFYIHTYTILLQKCLILMHLLTCIIQ